MSVLFKSELLSDNYFQKNNYNIESYKRNCKKGEAWKGRAWGEGLQKREAGQLRKPIKQLFIYFSPRMYVAAWSVPMI